MEHSIAEIRYCYHVKYDFSHVLFEAGAEI